MAVKPVKFISDVLTKKQIIKTDISGNVLFAVSGTLPDGSVSSSLPITASNILVNNDLEVLGTIKAKRMNITEVNTSVYYETSISASINALLDVSASNPVSGNVLTWSGTHWVVGTGNTADLISLSSSIESRFATIANLCETNIGFFDSDGTKNVELANYVYADLDYVMIDVMTKQSGTNVWKNDLVSIELSGNIITNKLYVLLSAPAYSDEDSYRIFVNKQTGSL